MMKNKYPDSWNIEVIGKDSQGNDRIIVNPISFRDAYNELCKMQLKNNQRMNRSGRMNDD